MSTRGEADYKQSRSRIPKAGNRAAPVSLVPIGAPPDAADLFAIGD
jgi:hypothetical protein